MTARGCQLACVGSQLNVLIGAMGALQALIAEAAAERPAMRDLEMPVGRVVAVPAAVSRRMLPRWALLADKAGSSQAVDDASCYLLGGGGSAAHASSETWGRGHATLLAHRRGEDGGQNGELQKRGRR